MSVCFLGSLSSLNLLLLLLLLLCEVILCFPCLCLWPSVLFVLLLKHDHIPVEFLVGVSFALLLHLIIDNGCMLGSVVSTLIPLVLPRLLLLLLLLLLSVVHLL